MIINNLTASTTWKRITPKLIQRVEPLTSTPRPGTKGSNNTSTLNTMHGNTRVRSWRVPNTQNTDMPTAPMAMNIRWRRT